ncbi:MAG: DUF6492 family protein [Lachnospiraceae bacterium]
MDIREYDGLVVVTPKDFQRIKHHHGRMIGNLPVRRLYFVGSGEVGRLLEEEKASGVIDGSIAEKALFLNEDDILPYEAVSDVISEAMQDVLFGEKAPRGLVGWYYQQFLKISYSKLCNDEYYFVWDGDTIPCREFSMFDAGGQPYLDYKQEHHKEYFNTIEKILPGMHKVIGPSFISEHMLFKTDTVKQMMSKIESNDGIKGTKYWEKIVNSLNSDLLQSNSFSEFETYGTYVALTDPMAYRLREWHSMRVAGMFFDMEKINERDFTWLGRDFTAISFEKNHYVREDCRNLFDNPEYQMKLTARQMLEVAQGAFYGGSYIEKWDYSNKDEATRKKERTVFILAGKDSEKIADDLSDRLVRVGENIVVSDHHYGDFESVDAVLASDLKAVIAIGCEIPGEEGLRKRDIKCLYAGAKDETGKKPDIILSAADADEKRDWDPVVEQILALLND